METELKNEAQEPTGGVTLGECLLFALRDAGAKEIFGIPGDFILPFFRVMEDSEILPFYTLSHEPSLGFAADGAARSCCRISVAVVTYGAGALNMVNPIAAAYAEKSPVVVISGGPAVNQQHADLLLHHQAKRVDSQFEIFREVTCAQTRLKDLATAPDEISRVLSACIMQSRPVYIELPRDLVYQPCLPAPPINLDKNVDQNALDACVEEVAGVLAKARSPVLMLGVETRRFKLEENVAKLARRLNIPTVTSFMGRGLLAQKSPQAKGAYIGQAGDPGIADMVESSDALMLIGVILSDTNFGLSKKRIDFKRCILAGDGDVSLGYHVYKNIPLENFVEAMLNRVQAARHPAKPSNSGPNVIYPCNLLADKSPVKPDDIARGVNDLIREHGPMQVFTDVGDCLFVAMRINDSDLAAPGYYASMGFAVPAGLGYQAASGNRPLILVGDGAFQMTGWELGNCSRYGWDPIVIVLNNSAWEMLRAFEPAARFNTLNQWKFADLAVALGGDSCRVQTLQEFQLALGRAYKQRGKFQLIEVVIADRAISKTMSDFVKGLKKQ